MSDHARFSTDVARLTWAAVKPLEAVYGPKGARLLALPRRWTPPFLLVPASATRSKKSIQSVIADDWDKLSELASETGQIAVRSSVIGETIWDRGTYDTVVLKGGEAFKKKSVLDAVQRVCQSAVGEKVAIVLQSYVEPKSRGEFGNLLRVSKTRDHWELSATSAEGLSARTRFNAQRDRAAREDVPIRIQSGVSRERLFASLAAWLNNELLRGHSQRVSCEWVTDNQNVFIVQIDDEDEDFSGTNPDQINIEAAYSPQGSDGRYFRAAGADARSTWDKLTVLNELWREETADKPMLFYAPFEALTSQDTAGIEADFSNLIGPDGIIVRTSVRAGTEKEPNLPRTECLTPAAAAAWCLASREQLIARGYQPEALAFVAHRFIAAHASAWARAEPRGATVEINALWGLPDALQFCPYDIWDVHLPTRTTWAYPDYKSNMLMSAAGGSWEYVRVKNEVARSLCVGRKEALDLATRTQEVANRLNKAVHVMWFVGCVRPDGGAFNVPWYWTEAHAAERNIDRTAYDVVVISDPTQLAAFKASPPASKRMALELRPTSLDLMRDNEFIRNVGEAAVDAKVPVILAGSTLAHAYFVLRKTDAAVISTGEKDHTRLRRSTTFGKLVRDKIPDRIASRHEAGVTQEVPPSLQPGFLTAKLIEEALEVRLASTSADRKTELADVLEIVRALAQLSGFALEDVIAAAAAKREKAGGFEKGLVLLQTGIAARERESGDVEQNVLPSVPLDRDRDAREVEQIPVLGRRDHEGNLEIPFSFFGFADIDAPRSFNFPEFGLRLMVKLKNDRIELSLSRDPDQLELPLDSL
ncbi:MAG: nucleoside triphosphate pyrophosphohydrolase [Hyphomonadaceae bacterium]|nr:nucleoside triphosphate pyrophosphohydrolase [Hyphomonadaceae bacterium]